MLHRVIGRAGSGKTTYITDRISECLAEGIDCLYIVPEQQSMNAETMLEERGAVSLNAEVLNFERLPDHVFRHVGGCAVKPLDKAASFVCLADAVEALKDKLSAYSDPTAQNISALSASISALKRLSVTPDSFDGICTDLKKSAGDGLWTKLSELKLIYRKYEEILNKSGIDTDDAPTLLCRVLETEPYFKGKAVFLDGMYTYTEQQYAIIRHIAKQAAEFYVSFTADDDASGIFDGINESARRIKELAGGVCRDIILPESRRTEDEALSFLESHLWQGKAVYEKEASAVALCRCADRREEALFAARQVFMLRNKGLRFGDIAIACRNPEDYDGVIDTVFARYNIPFYFSNKESAATKPLSAFVSGILEMAERGCTVASVKKYIKSAFSVLSREEADKLLQYAEGWRIRGKAWYADRDWLMNPDGYQESFTPMQELKLKQINAIRAKFAASIAPIMEVLQSKSLTVGAAVKALYAHMNDCAVREKLAANAEKLKAAGDDDEAAKTVRLWGVFTDIFDRLYALSESRPCKAGELRDLTELMLSGYDIGAIPSYTDAVDIGSARLMRAGGVKAMIILGVNDGVFPSMPEQSGIFSAEESAVIEQGGVAFLPSPEKAMNEECFFFYNCVASPTDYLAISCLYGGSMKPSVAYNAVAAMFPFNPVRRFGEDERDFLFCRTAAADRLPYIKNKALKASLTEKLAESGYVPPQSAPLQDEKAYVGELSIRFLMLSATKINCYNNCGFHYLMEYILKLNKERVFEYSVSNNGTYMHYLLEHFMKKRMESGAYVPADDAECKAEIDALSLGYFDSMFPDGLPKRTELLVSRLKNAVLHVCRSLNEEFSTGEFAPEGFEIQIGNGGVAPPMFVTSDGKRISTSGKIDRVDSAFIDGKRYVRVADYKSSEIPFSVEGVERGENFQMLSYLFAYCDDSADGAVPAGVLYRSLEPPQNGKEKAQRGVILEDNDIPKKMDPLNKFTKSAQKLSAEGFSKLRELCLDHIKETGESILGGRMDIKPFKLEETDCGFCRFGDICRMRKPKKF